MTTVQSASPVRLRNTVAGVLEDRHAGQRAAEALRRGGFAAQDVHLWSGAEAGVDSLWRSHGRMQVLWDVVSEVRAHSKQYQEALKDGQVVVVAAVHGEEEARRAAATLAEAGAHGVRHFGRWVITDVALPPAPRQQTNAEPAWAPAVTAGDLRAADVFAGLTADECAAVAGIARRVHMPVGSLIASQGYTADGVYVVVSGEVQLSITTAQGEITVRIAGAGEALPLAALLGERRLITSAHAMTDVEAILVPSQQLDVLCARRLEIGFKTYRAVAELLGSRYSNTLSYLVATMEHSVPRDEVFANV